MHKENKINSKTIYEGKVLKLTVDDVKCYNDVISTREIIHHNGGACILGIKDDAIILEKQYRYAYDEVIYELPAGKLEKNEDAISAAKREFLEETGYKANNMFSLGVVYPSVGYTNEIIHLFYTNDFTFDKTNFDADEYIEIEFVKIKDVMEMINNSIIKDAKTIVCLYKYLNLSKII